MSGERRRTQRTVTSAQDAVREGFLDDVYTLGHEDAMEVSKQILADRDALLEAMKSIKACVAYMKQSHEQVAHAALSGRQRVKLGNTFDETSVMKLSGLLNRRVFDYLCERASPQMKRDGALAGGVYGCVAYIDLDHLKALNDTYGHGHADTIISQLGRELSAQFRAYDIVGHLSGDEFAVIAPRLVKAKMIEHLNAVLKKFSVPRRAEHFTEAGVWSNFRPTFTFAVEEIRFPDNLKDHLADAERNVLAQKASRNENRGELPHIPHVTVTSI